MNSSFEQEIKTIREKADIVEIIKTYVNLTPKGKNYFGVCPFHQDHSPSMSVSSEKQVFKCFSCGAGGNVFQFVKDYENVSFTEAVKIVATKVGLTFNYNHTHERKKVYEKEYKIMALAKSFFQNNLNSEAGLAAKKYLNDRNITENMLKTFAIGLSLKNNSLYKLLSKKDYDNDVLENLGIIRKSGLNIYDVFQNRIMFPIENPNGEVVGFTGRVYLEGETPKYLNSKETIIFKKGQVLYNYHRAKENIRQNKNLIIVEGNMDAMRMYTSGLTSTIALMGTSLTKDQIDLIKKLRVPVILMLDNDDAGNINTYQNGLLLEKENIIVSVVRLSKVKDPDEYIKTFGIEAMKDLLKTPLSFLEFKLKYLQENKNLKDTKELVSYIKEVIKSLKSADALTVDATIRKLAKEYDLSYEVLKKEADAELEIKQEIAKITTEPKVSKTKEKRYDLCAKAILYYMMNNPKYITMYQNRLSYFNEKKYRQIASEVIYYYEKNKTINLADFLSYAEISPLKDDIISLTKSIKITELTDANMEEYLTSIKKIMINDELKDLKKSQLETLDVNEKVSIALRITKLMQEKEEL